MKKENLISALRELSESELTKIFYEAFSPLRKKIDGDVDDVYIIGNAGYCASDNSALISVSALPRENTVEAEAMVQDGFCENCKIDISCTSKDAICPICNAIIDCT